MFTVAPSMINVPPVGVQVLPTLARQPAWEIAAAERIAPYMPCVLEIRAWVCMAMNRGNAAAASMPTMAITTTSSISVKPVLLGRTITPFPLKRLPQPRFSFLRRLLEPSIGCCKLESHPKRSRLSAGLRGLPDDYGPPCDPGPHSGMLDEV